MTEPIRRGLDGDVLPTPIDGTQEYLAAIFDELRALRTGAAPADEVSPQPAPDIPEGPAPAPLPVEIREPEVTTTVDELIAPTEQAVKALEEVGIEAPKPAAKKAAKKPVARKASK